MGRVARKLRTVLYMVSRDTGRFDSNPFCSRQRFAVGNLYALELEDGTCVGTGNQSIFAGLSASV